MSIAKSGWETFRRRAKRSENEIGALCDAEAGEQNDIVAQGRVVAQQAVIFCNRLVETMAPFSVGDVELWPGWRHEMVRW